MTALTIPQKPHEETTMPRPREQGRFDNLIDSAGIAALCGVSRQRVHQWSTDLADFPEHVCKLNGGKVWLRDQVEAWWQARPAVKR